METATNEDMVVETPRSDSNNTGEQNGVVVIEVPPNEGSESVIEVGSTVVTKKR